MKKLTSILLLLLITTTAYAKQALPLLSNISHIEISSTTLDTLSINEDQRIDQIVQFLNQYQSGWGLSEKVDTPSILTLSFFSDGMHITNIGISTSSIHCLYGKDWTQNIPENKIKQFAGSIHPAISENLFPIYPVDQSSKNTLKLWQKKLNQLQAGSDQHQIKSFLHANNIRIKHVDNAMTNQDYWMNLELSLINDGDYINTVIAAKMFLNKDHSLKSSRFLGYQLSKKSSIQKHLASN